MKNKVAIIILNWNGGSVTLDCLNSISKITYPNFRVFLVDNGSVDGSIEMLKKQVEPSSIRFIELKENHGFTGGNNIGIKIAQREYDPDYFLLLNNDTVVDARFLTELVYPFEFDNQIGITVPKIFFYDKPATLYYAGGYLNKFSGLGSHCGWKKEDAPEFNISKEITFANGCSMLIKKEVIEKVGMLDDIYFAISEDTDYSSRVLAQGFKMRYVPSSFLWHKEGYVSKKNIGNWFRMYLTTRNLILFQSRNASFGVKTVFILVFLVRWYLYMSLKLLVKMDIRSVKAILLGTTDGITGKLRYVKRPTKIIFAGT